MGSCTSSCQQAEVEHVLVSQVGGDEFCLAKSVAQKGGVEAWNGGHEELHELVSMIDRMVTATTVDEALMQVKAVTLMENNLWGYAYMRMLYSKRPDLYYGALLADPVSLLPVVYTPTVGEACQKFGKMPFYTRGCYISITDRGNIQKVLEAYSERMLKKGPDGRYECDCIVFSDGGRVLGLGDLAAWGMGIPIGKLDLYCVCAGVNPYKTIPVIIDAGCAGPEGNTGRLVVRDHPLYTGLKQDRVMHKSDAGTLVNSAYYGPGNMIDEFMGAATQLFGRKCLLQFEDFNSNDAFPLLAEYRNKYLTYNDDIQGTAAICVAGLLGAMKLRDPAATNLIERLQDEVFLFHGAGSANIGALSLLKNEAGVPARNLFVTNSSGMLWKNAQGTQGNYKNNEQKEFATVGQPDYDITYLPSIIAKIKATCLIGAVGRDPDCFNKGVVQSMCQSSRRKRPVVFAMSNPKTQAEITSENAYAFSEGKAIFGSGTKMESVMVDGKLRSPGQVNNIYIFPGVSMGAICCEATNIPERLFMIAAEAVANSLKPEDMQEDRVLPQISRIREVGLNVAVAVVLECQKLGLAGKDLGANTDQVKAVVSKMMWSP